MKYYLNVIRNYASFSGRARRKEYWMFVLFNNIFFVAIVIFELIILELDLGFSTIIPMEEGGQGVLNAAYLILMIIPSIAVGVRRMHDVGKSGWFLLVPIYNIILTFQEGERNENEYGPDPKNIENN
jgi:uncharacterized membrane protein YhaH (DUF805 family)